MRRKVLDSPLHKCRRHTWGLALALLLLWALNANATGANAAGANAAGANTAGANTAGANTADQTYHRVRWVADGDTIVLEDGRHIRYLGINTPETDHDGKIADPFGKAARRYNRQLVEKQTIRLEFDQERQDRYGRWLAHVHRRDGLWVNQAMVAKGLAIYLYTPKNRRHGHALLSAQRDAMRKRVGLWQPGPDATIWQGRYLGNRRSRRFHHSNCTYGRRTSRRNQVWFTSQWNAYQSGYAPGSKCLGRTPGAELEVSD